MTGCLMSSACFFCAADEVARFATTEELPPVSAITSSVEISGNTAPVQHGNGNAIISTQGLSGTVYILSNGSITFKFIAQ